MSTYQYSTCDSICTAASPQKPPEYYEFVTFLGIAQKLGIDFLPITWQQALGNIGEGGSGEIREAFLDVNTSLAFKRRLFTESFDLEEFRGHVLPSVIAEISILLAAPIRYCPNVVNIVGICWEIYCEDNCAFSRDEPVKFSSAAAVPVLVFERSKHGDLHDFMTNGAGKALSFDERLQLCIEISNAISTMHSIGVIHGDIKPQNVLIFQTSTHIFTARVADFGYSTVHATENDMIHIPRSLNWTAPEWHHRGFLPAQGRKMDIYSLGLLVLWILCCNNLTSTEPQSHITMPASSKDEPTFIEESLKGVQLPHSAAFIDLFRDCLNENAAERSSDVAQLCDFLSGEKISSPVGTPVPLDGVYPEGITKEWLMEQDTSACTKQDVRDQFTAPRNTYDEVLQYSTRDSFKLMYSMYQLYCGDYRVRIYIANCLIHAASFGEADRSSDTSSGTLCVQAALCYETGFGVARSEEKSHDIVRGRHSYVLEISRQLKYICQEGIKDHWSNGIFSWGKREGSVQLIDPIQKCGGAIGWGMFRREYRAEISDTSHAFGKDHHIVLILKDDLGNGCFAFDRWGEAEMLHTEVVQSRGRTLGENHIQTIASWVTLADIYRRQTRIPEAQALQEELHETLSHPLVAHPCWLMNTESLALTYSAQGRWEESVKLLEDVLRQHFGTLGPEHLKSLRTRMSLMQSFMERGNYAEAEKMGTQVLEILERTQGTEHPDTLLCRLAVAQAHHVQGRLEDAENLLVPVLQSVKSVFGDGHHDTVDAMSTTADIYYLQNRILKAIEVQEDVIRIMMLNPGYTNHDKCSQMGHMADMYEANDQIVDAIRIREEKLAVMRETVGVQYAMKILEMAFLADLYWDQGRRREALELMSAASEDLEKAREEEEPDVIEDLKICITRRRSIERNIGSQNLRPPEIQLGTNSDA